MASMLGAPYSARQLEFDLEMYRMTAEKPLPLADIKVIEFSHAVMGPSAGMVFGDLGADVVKVEPTPNGDRTRHLKSAGAGFFGFYCRNKRSIALNLKAPAVRPVVEALIRQADVVIENFAPGTMDKLGLGYDDLRKINPGLVYCALKGFLSGPYEERRALDEIAQMMSGLAFMTGPPGKPMRAGASVVDILGGMSGVIGVLAALREREKTGEGQLVKAGLFEAAAFTMGQFMVQYVATGEPLQPLSRPVRAWGIYDIFQSSDGKSIFIGIVTDTQWRRFCDVFDRPDLMADERLTTNGDRVDCRPWLVPQMAAFFATFGADDLFAKCEEALLAFGPVNRPEDLFDDPHLNAGGRLVEATLPGGKRAKVPRLPFEMDGRWFSARTNAPTVSEHAYEVLQELGVDQTTIDALAAAGDLVLPSRADTSVAAGND